jgi:tetratricopeptide (TPR) repeat protein
VKSSLGQSAVVPPGFVLLLVLACAPDTSSTQLPAWQALADDALETEGGHAVRRLEQRVLAALAEPSPASDHLPEDFGELAGAYYEAGFIEAAGNALRYAAERSPEDGRWPYLLALTLAEQGDDDGARNTLEVAIRLAPDYLPAVIELGQRLLASGRRQAAGTHFRRALAQDPELAAAHLGLAELALAQGDIETAIDYLHRVLELQPRARRVHYTIAQAYRQAGQPDRAAEHLRLRSARAVQLTDPWRDTLIGGVTAYGRQRSGVQLVRAGRYDAAVSILRPQVAAAPMKLRLRINLALALLRSGDLAGAETHYRWLIANAGRDAAGHLGLALLAEARGDGAAGAAHSRAALERNPQSSHAHLLLGRSLWAVGAIATARPHFEEALRLDPAGMLGHLMLAATSAREGDYRQALARVEAGIEIVPDAPELWQFLARVLAACPDSTIRDPARALDWARRAHGRLQTRESTRTLAMALAGNGRFTEASGLLRGLISRADGLAPTTRAELTDELHLYQARRQLRLPWWEPVPAR